MYILQLGYALPISILYLFVILKILKAHKSEQVFSDAYFKIYVLDGVVSMLVVLLDYGLTRPLIYVNPMCYLFSDWFPDPTYILTPYLFGFNYFQFAKIFSISLLSANRFTCVAYPIWHKIFWKKHTNHVIIVAMICPVLFTWQLAISPTRFDMYVGEGILGYVKVVPFAILLIFSTSFLVENIAFGSLLKKFEFICNDFYLMSSPIVLLIMNKRLRTKVFRVSPEVPQNSSNTKLSSKNGESIRIVVKSPSAKTLTMW
uniref:Serpentine receptor class gamma n=1 Tax=Caenorhabditis tropicalis TaxID=1561998 RepID=A0A1I7UVQ6_9PELO